MMWYYIIYWRKQSNQGTADLSNVNLAGSFTQDPRPSPRFGVSCSQRMPWIARRSTSPHGPKIEDWSPKMPLLNYLGRMTHMNCFFNHRILMDLMDLGHNGNGFNWIFIAIFIAGEVVRLQLSDFPGSRWATRQKKSSIDHLRKALVIPVLRSQINNQRILDVSLNLMLEPDVVKMWLSTCLLSHAFWEPEGSWLCSRASH